MAASRGIRSQMTSSREAVAFRGTARMISSTPSPRRASICSLITSGRPESTNRGTARTNVDGELRTSGSAVQFSPITGFSPARSARHCAIASSKALKLAISRFMARDASSSTQMRIAARPPLSVESVVNADIATVGKGPTDRSSPPQAGFFRVRRDENSVPRC